MQKEVKTDPLIYCKGICFLHHFSLYLPYTNLNIDRNTHIELPETWFIFKLKADWPHPRDYPHNYAPDYRHRDWYPTLVIANLCSKLEGKLLFITVHKHTNGQMDTTRWITSLLLEATRSIKITSKDPYEFWIRGENLLAVRLDETTFWAGFQLLTRHCL